MRIKTKLILTLGAISLFPLVAAYITLISSPRISFAVRMNKYEAEQGTGSQKLQGDLQAVGSALEESLNETYRIKVEPKQRADAERQRKLANEAVHSNVVAFEKTWKRSRTLQHNKSKRLWPQDKRSMLPTSVKRNS